MTDKPVPVPDAGKNEAHLIAVRREKAKKIRARGENPFANDLAAFSDIEHCDIAAVRERCAAGRTPAGRYDSRSVPELAVHLAGRILFLRSFGAVTFIRVRDRTGEIQLWCDEASLKAQYARLDDFDLGDIVEVEGMTCATNKGELSLRPTSIRVLTKSLLPLPTKTSFKDVEQRYRMRYVDLIANPDVAQVFRARTEIVRALRAFLDGRGFLEVETPTLHPLVGGAAAKPFTTHHNALDMQLYLRIAPELYLKRLVVGGFERVYEIGRCYRNEGLSTRHNPEFTMLEYYQAYATYRTLMDQTEAMLRFVDDSLAAAMPEEHAKWRAARPFSLEQAFVRVSLNDAVEQALQRANLPADVRRIEAYPQALKQWAKDSKAAGREIDWANFKNGLQKCGSDGERLFCVYEYIAEPFLDRDYLAAGGEKSLPVFITDYPFEVSPLARKKDADPTLVDRFELFIHGKEVCNAFSELNDPDDQAERFRAQVEMKERGAEETMDFDRDYIRALEYGMPPAAGFGMGCDRLTMMLTCSASIRDVILFPLLRPE